MCPGDSLRNHGGGVEKMPTFLRQPVLCSDTMRTRSVSDRRLAIMESPHSPALNPPKALIILSSEPVNKKEKVYRYLFRQTLGDGNTPFPPSRLHFCIHHSPSFNTMIGNQVSGDLSESTGVSFECVLYKQSTVDIYTVCINLLKCR